MVVVGEMMSKNKATDGMLDAVRFHFGYMENSLAHVL
jgi:hypothetical protein